MSNLPDWMKPERLYVEFGRLVRAYRRQLGLTQDDLAERVGLSRTSITNVEQGRQKVLLHQVFLLAESLGVSPDALLPNMRVVQALPHIEQKLPKNLTGSQKDWVRRVVALSSEEGGTPHAGSKD